MLQYDTIIQNYISYCNLMATGSINMTNSYRLIDMNKYVGSKMMLSEISIMKTKSADK